ncbi:MAG: hypothetical protein JF595_09085 [Sphingomonadales bacterium]|nr:hypothetical protein [Sphingomonadales bacterium]
MPKVSVVTPEKTHEVRQPAGYAGLAKALAYYDDEKSPLHLHLHRIAPGEVLRIGPMPTDCVAYVWHGAIEAVGWALAKGSSLIVEHGETLLVTGGADEPAELLTFHAAHPPEKPRAGGHVHLLPSERVPRLDDLGGGSGVGGGMHADSGCPTCEVWLHENHFPGGRPPLTPEQEKQGIHSHSEDEIIFVTDGGIRLGNRLYGPGTAVAIAADTLYSFTTGPEGLSFINFRAGTPGDIQFASGMAMSETGYWRDKQMRPEYVTPR